ncbi:MAG: phosphomannomutase/phosphoglucomutase, partial [Selenomonas sp.]|nr:phosphomannomutase/phosphoglucomutase [Selenomonas sp.]
MLTKDAIMKLANGSDVRGVAVEGVADEPVTLTAEAVNRIAGAFVEFLARRSGKKPGELKITIGHDARISAPMLMEAAVKGLRAKGAAVLDCGLASTPAMFMSIIFPETAADGAVMLTASHLPYNRNGMKFFTASGGLEHEDIHAILE